MVREGGDGTPYSLGKTQMVSNSGLIAGGCRLPTFHFKIALPLFFCVADRFGSPETCQIIPKVTPESSMVARRAALILDAGIYLPDRSTLNRPRW
jgi:hypothetical protein